MSLLRRPMKYIRIMDSLEEESGYFIILELELEVNGLRMFLYEMLASFLRGDLRRKIKNRSHRKTAFTSLPCQSCTIITLLLSSPTERQQVFKHPRPSAASSSDPGYSGSDIVVASTQSPSTSLYETIY